MATRTRTTRLVWSAADEELLLQRYRAGGTAAAIAAFPHRTPQSTRAALRRVTFFRPTDEVITVCDREFVRAKIAALPYDLFCERLAALVTRRAYAEGVA